MKAPGLSAADADAQGDAAGADARGDSGSADVLRRRRFLFGPGFVLAIAVTLPFDLQITRWVIAVAPPDSAARGLIDFVRDVLTSPKTWGGLCIAAVVFVERRRLINQVALSGVASAIAIHGLKWLFGRARPELGLGALHFMPLSDPRLEYDSFPSGHTTNAFVVVALIAQACSQLRWPMWALAALVGLSRIASERHFASDTIAGAALGVAIVAWSRTAVERWAKWRGWRR